MSADQLPLPPALPAAATQLLDQAHRGLREAAGCTDPRQRYATAHLGALRAAAAVLAARTRPEPARGRPRSAWVLLGQVAPELGEWATFFAAGAAKRAAAEAGSTRAVTEREADDLVRDADRFLTLVEQALGLAPHLSTHSAPHLSARVSAHVSSQVLPVPGAPVRGPVVRAG
jgi:hypothetical protein